MLPNWIIIGAPKSSTSSLFRWLVDHPEVSGPAEKETYYFVDPGTHMFRRDRNFRDHGLAGYQALFAGCDPASAVVVEATPSYLYSETALRTLPNLPGEPQFLVVLREPVSQIGSLHAYFQQNWSWIPRSMSLAEFVAAAEAGDHDFNGNELAVHALENADYLPYLKRWRDAVGEERVLILLFDDLIGDSRSTMRRIAQRMGIDPNFYDNYDFPAENTTYVARLGLLQDLNIWLRARLPQGSLYALARRAYRAVNTRSPDRNPSLADAEVRNRLAARYAPKRAALEREFGLDLSRWRSESEQTSTVEEPDRSANGPAAKRLAAGARK